MLQIGRRLLPCGRAVPVIQSGQAGASSSRLLVHRSLYHVLAPPCAPSERRYQYRTYATDAEQASTSTGSSGLNVQPLGNASPQKSTSTPEKKKLHSRKSRRRLARLAARLRSSSAVESTPAGKEPSITQKVWHPSRPKDMVKVRKKAEKRWRKKRGEAAAAGAVDSYRQSVRFDKKPRALHNVERAEAAGYGEIRSDRFKKQAAKPGKRDRGARDARESLDVADTHLKGSVIDKAWAKVFEKTRPPQDQPDHTTPRREQVIPETELLTGQEAKEAKVVSQSKSIELGSQSDVGQYFPYERVPRKGNDAYEAWHSQHKWNTAIGGVLSPKDVPVEKVDPLRPMEVARLAHGIDRALFNPTVFWLREPRTGIYNFDPRIRNLYDVDMFDYKALPPYLTSSVDPELAQIARDKRKKYRGSTSTLTALLSQIYFCISARRPPRLTGFSEGFANEPKGFSFGARLPASIKLRRYEDDDPVNPDGPKLVSYAIDNDKTATGEAENSNYVLTQLGKSVEKLLTSEVEEYEKYLRINSHKLTEEEKTKPESYYYSESPKFLMRSQLDCSDDRLPRKTFDLKTRSAIAVRIDRANWVESSGYLIRNLRGVHESFERELWDMTRSAFLKYYFQARIGDMDGILVAFHSTTQVFGFQYIPREEMQMQLFSSVEMGEQAFLLCIGMLERILDAVTEIYPDDTLRITMDTTVEENPKLLVFAQPDGANPDDESPEKRLLKFEVEVDRYLSGALVRGPVDFEAPEGHRIDITREDEIARRQRAELPPVEWTLEYAIRPCSHLTLDETKQSLASVMARHHNVVGLTMPNVEAINRREAALEKALSENTDALNRYLQDIANDKNMGMPRAPGQVAPGTALSSVGTTDARQHPFGQAAFGQHATSDMAANAATHIVSIDDGDVDAAKADLSEKTSMSEETQGHEDSIQEQSDENYARWQPVNSRQIHFRRLARLGREDNERLAETDPLEMYERRDSK